VSKAEIITGGLAAALARGEAAKVDWVRTGELVPAKQLAQAWGVTPQTLSRAERRGEVFAVTVKRLRYYPHVFLQLGRQNVGAVCRELAGLTPVEQYFFWERKHGALKGKTIPQVLAECDVAKAVEFAQIHTAQMRAEAAVEMKLNEPLASYRRAGETAHQALQRLRDVVATADDVAFETAVNATPEGARILQLATSVLGDATAARVWLTKPAYGLNGAVPLELMSTTTGRAQVLELLGRLNDGVYS
jgi:uncharacterized protein (DUF2384 family)